MGIAATTTNAGYWLVASDGAIYAFGDAAYKGGANTLPTHAPIVAVAGLSDNAGYWELANDGAIYTYGTALYFGGATAGTPPNDLRAMIVQRAKDEYARRVVETPSKSNCNPYTAFWSRGTTAGCAPGTRAEKWCADFAAYIWQVSGGQTAGLTSMSGSFYSYGQQHGTFKTSNPQLGDAVIFGNRNDPLGATHVGIVTAINNSTSITMISGNYSDAVSIATFDPNQGLSSIGAVIGYTSSVR